MNQIVVLDGHTLNPGDLSWKSLQALGDLEVYERSKPEQVLERSKDANILVSNKVILDSELLHQLDKLECICVSATGFNNIDVRAARSLRIPVCNVVGYGSVSVAQHVFALMLALSNRAAEHSAGVHLGEWSEAIDWSYSKRPIIELAGKNLGIYGLGKIGSQVARIGLAFGMKIISHHKHPERDKMQGVKFTDFEKLCRKSDFLSLHAPLSKENEGIINRQSLEWMKSSAFLINTGRGALVVESDLRNALENGIIAGAGLDVLSEEPPPLDHVLLGAPNCLITPHHAWASRASRQRCLDIVVENISAFLKGHPQNVVNV